jgi:hypothetical protein
MLYRSVLLAAPLVLAACNQQARAIQVETDGDAAIYTFARWLEGVWVVIGLVLLGMGAGLFAKKRARSGVVPTMPGLGPAYLDLA